MKLPIIFSLLLLIHYTRSESFKNVPKRLIFNKSRVDYHNSVLFYLFTRSNANVGHQIWLDNKASLANSSYDSSKDTKFITHGWESDSTAGSCIGVKNGFLSHADYNVVIVDWSALSVTPNYINAASRVQEVGLYVGKMITFMVNHGSDVNGISLVGHSLGAHVMGIAGYSLNFTVPHLVGLDPARPGFEKQPVTGRLTKEDAERVEIIHTSLLGIFEAFGDNDYYPNGGRVQPGCEIDVSNTCAHGRSYEYYAESLTNPENWYAIQCSGYTKFQRGLCDGNTIQSFPRWSANFLKSKGVFELRTNSKAPFGLGLDGCIPKNQTLQDLLSSATQNFRNITKAGFSGLRDGTTTSSATNIFSSFFQYLLSFIYPILDFFS